MLYYAVVFLVIARIAALPFFPSQNFGLHFGAELRHSE